MSIRSRLQVLRRLRDSLSCSLELISEPEEPSACSSLAIVFATGREIWVGSHGVNITGEDVCELCSGTLVWDVDLDVQSR